MFAAIHSDVISGIWPWAEFVLLGDSLLVLRGDAEYIGGRPSQHTKQMTATPTKTTLGQAEVKYAAVIRKLDAIAEELVKAELWDEQRIQTVAGLH